MQVLDYYKLCLLLNLKRDLQTNPQRNYIKNYHIYRSFHLIKSTNKLQLLNLDSAADFCPQCHFMFELPEVLDVIECNRCGYKCSISDYQPKYIISTIKMEPKSWLSNQPQDNIEQVCPKCSHEEAYFSTAQLRSADESSTVFYECVKCQFRYQLNN